MPWSLTTTGTVESVGFLEVNQWVSVDKSLADDTYLLQFYNHHIFNRQIIVKKKQKKL